MATYDISLPSTKKPAFPTRCVCCDTENPSTVVGISVTGTTTGPSWKELAADAVLGGGSPVSSNIRVTVEVPACPACGRALKRRHFWKAVALYGGGLGGAAFFGLALLQGHSGWFASLGLVVGVLGPVIYELKYPPGFTFTPAGGKTNYEFRSRSYAEEFAVINGAGPAGSA